jgi:hypothetical protein
MGKPTFDQSAPKIIITIKVEIPAHWQKYMPYLDNIINNIIPKIEVNFYAEAIQNGFIMYFQEFEDLEKFFKYKLVKLEPPTSLTPPSKPLLWTVEVNQNNSEKLESDIIKVLGTAFLNLGLHIKPIEDQPHTYTFQFQSAEFFFQAIEKYIGNLRKESDKE